MQGSERLLGRGARSTFLRILFTPRTHPQYTAFLREQGFEDFLRIPSFTLRHEIGEALVQRFHAKIDTFHLSCGEYAVLPFDWTAILRIKFDGHQIPTEEMSFDMACDLLGIPLPLTAETGGEYFRPIALP